jgi:hypothetical protein
MSDFCPECGSPKPSPWRYCSDACDAKAARETLLSLRVAATDLLLAIAPGHAVDRAERLREMLVALGGES